MERTRRKLQASNELMKNINYINTKNMEKSIRNQERKKKEKTLFGYTGT